MMDFANRISGAALLALAVLPMAALATGAHAETRVQVADINLATADGVAIYGQRADAAGRKFCLPERSLNARAACRAGVKIELDEKMAALRTAQRDGGSQTFAAR